MSGQVKCGSCGATYSPVQADGMRYFHACAPLPHPQLATVQGKVSKGTPLTAEELGILVNPWLERADKRDENIDHAAHLAHLAALDEHGQRADRKAFARGEVVPYIRAIGKGVTPA